MIGSSNQSHWQVSGSHLGCGLKISGEDAQIETILASCHPACLHVRILQNRQGCFFLVDGEWPLSPRKAKVRILVVLLSFLFVDQLLTRSLGLEKLPINNKKAFLLHFYTNAFFVDSIIVQLYLLLWDTWMQTDGGVTAFKSPLHGWGGVGKRNLLWAVLSIHGKNEWCGGDSFFGKRNWRKIWPKNGLKWPKIA